VSVPVPTPIYRILHVNNLSVCLQRGALHAPLHTPSDGLVYQTIHNVDIQKKRNARSIPCGPGGVIHDYVSFYFGPRSPMLFQLHTGQVPGYMQGQEQLIYLVSTAQAVQATGAGLVFSDGHGIAAFTGWFDDLADLGQVEWGIVNAKFWNDTADHPDRQRRKQAEFLVHQRCGWALVHEIGVLNEKMQAQVQGILAGYPAAMHRPVHVRPQWYY